MNDNDQVPNVDMSGGELSADEKAQFLKELGEKNTLLQKYAGTNTLEEARLQLDIAEILIWLDRKAAAWTLARQAFAISLNNASWQDAVEACNVLYQTGQTASTAALGMGVWLAVTFPVAPELTFAMLDHVVTVSQADDAALAAVTARYVIDLRADDAEHEDWSLLANDLIARVASRHSDVQDQQGLNNWMDRLALRDPAVFLPRLSRVISTMVGEAWWFDRDALRETLPD